MMRSFRMRKGINYYSILIFVIITLFLVCPSFLVQKYDTQINDVSNIEVESSNISAIIDEFKLRKCKCENNLIKLEDPSALKTNAQFISYSSCDLVRMIRRGFNQKVISVSMTNISEFRDVLKLSNNFRDWSIRVYYDSQKFSTYEICDLMCDDEINKNNQNIDFCSINYIQENKENIRNKTFVWKWLPIGDPFVDYFISVDMKKSAILENVLLEIKEWMSKEKEFLVIRGKQEINILLLNKQF